MGSQPSKSQHEEFVIGFGDALGLEGDPRLARLHYKRWVKECGLNEIELIDAESTGYQGGLEAGAWYELEMMGQG